MTSQLPRLRATPTYLTAALFSLALLTTSGAQAATLVSCTNGLPGGDNLSRAFYIPNYSGVDLQSVTLDLSSNTAGSYTFSLTARAGAYNGTLIGTSNATVILTNNSSANVATTFNFPSPAVTPGTTVTFTIGLVSSAGGSQFFSTPGFSGDPTCPAVETDDSTPPLSTFRRQGVKMTVTGTAATGGAIPALTPWGIALLAGLLGVGGLIGLRRTRRAAA